MTSLSVQTEAKGSVFVVVASGRIDSESAPAFDEALTKALSENPKLVLDLKSVEYMSSAGIRSVVKTSQASHKSGGAVKLAAVPESVNSILYTVGLNQMITSYATVEEAVASFQDQ